ncbi:MAG: hypothetical protein WC756_20760 [Taibaiella sp.]|jgi:hypothetical protein
MPKEDDLDLDGPLYFTLEEIYGSAENNLMNSIPDVIVENADLIEALAKAKQQQQKWLEKLQQGDEYWSSQTNFTTMIIKHLIRQNCIDKTLLPQLVDDAYFPLRLWFNTSTFVSPTIIEEDPENLENSLAQTLQLNEILRKKIDEYDAGLNIYKKCTMLLLVKLRDINPATTNINIIKFPPFKNIESSGSEKVMGIRLNI